MERPWTTFSKATKRLNVNSEHDQGSLVPLEDGEVKIHGRGDGVEEEGGQGFLVKSDNGPPESRPKPHGLQHLVNQGDRHKMKERHERNQGSGECLAPDTGEDTYR
jgi:hypothetical protein